MRPRFDDPVTSQIVDFLDSIGLPVFSGEVDDCTFLPGIDVHHGALIIEETKLKYPGDLLHEAGHLAVTRAKDRAGLSGEVRTPDAIPEIVESVAMIWSYAACLHLRIDPRLVFHKDGYQGRSSGLLKTFELGLFPGLHALEEAGMTLSPQEAARVGMQPFPSMLKWLRD